MKTISVVHKFNWAKIYKYFLMYELIRSDIFDFAPLCCCFDVHTSSDDVDGLKFIFDKLLDGIQPFETLMHILNIAIRKKSNRIGKTNNTVTVDKVL